MEITREMQVLSTHFRTGCRFMPAGNFHFIENTSTDVSIKNRSCRFENTNSGDFTGNQSENNRDFKENYLTVVDNKYSFLPMRK